MLDSKSKWLSMSFIVLLFVGKTTAGVFVGPSCQTYCLRDILHDFALFALHSSTPDVRHCRPLVHCDRIKLAQAGVGLESSNYLTILQHNLYGPLVCPGKRPTVKVTFKMTELWKHSMNGLWATCVRVRSLKLRCPLILIA